MRMRRIPIALTIAGSDSGGGAGIQADLKTFASLGVHGTCVITALTAQNPKGVFGVQLTEETMVRKQLEAVFNELKPLACKTGMLSSSRTVELVADFARGQLPLVVDPVMVATSGASLIHPGAVKVLRRKLLPAATLVTPNVPEAEAILERSIKNVGNLREAARALYEQYGSAALVKGGHLRGGREVVDFFFDGRTELMLTAPRIATGPLHGTGCTYSAAITAYVARGKSLTQAVELAKTYITEAIVQRRFVERHSVLNSFWS